LKKYIDLEDMANLNCSNILNIIQKNGAVSRKEIIEFSGLSWGGMTKIVNKLLENGYIIENGQEGNSSLRGRIPSLLSINTEKNFIIGFDLNQMGLTAVVMNLTGEILERFSAPADFKTREELEEKSIDFLSEIFKNYAENSIIAIGVAMQGIVDKQNGICERFFFENKAEIIPIKDIIEKAFPVRVFIEHDPDCILFSHMEHDRKENAVLLRIDRGIGMAAAVAGKIIKGKGIFEIAHNCVIPDGLECRCGKRGCLAAYTSQCIDDENEIIPEKLDDLILPLTVMLQNLSNLFDADRVILTGALMEKRELFEKELLKKFYDLKLKAKIEFFPISDFAVKGAGLIAIKKSIASLEV